MVTINSPRCPDRPALRRRRPTGHRQCWSSTELTGPVISYQGNPATLQQTVRQPSGPRGTGASPAPQNAVAAYRLPNQRIWPHDSIAAHSGEQRVALTNQKHAVDRRLRHKNTLPTATGPDLQLPVARERQIRVP
jgi:hypothetical protein